MALAEANCAICLAGNHDLAVVDVLSLRGVLARRRARRRSGRRTTIRPATREFLLGLSPSGEAEGVGLYHASPRDPIWEYVLSGLTAELCLDAAPQRVSLIGHSHVALSFHRPEGEPASGVHPPRRRRCSTSAAASGCSTPARPASRATATRARPGWCSTRPPGRPSGGAADYDLAGAQAAIRAARLPDSLAERLQYGQ